MMYCTVSMCDEPIYDSVFNKIQNARVELAEKRDKKKNKSPSEDGVTEEEKEQQKKKSGGGLGVRSRGNTCYGSYSSLQYLHINTCHNNNNIHLSI